MLTIDPDVVRRIIPLARQFDMKVEPADEDPGSNMAEDEMVEVLEDRPEDDAVEEELGGYIDQLNVDEKIELVALAWIGRGSYDAEEWEEALREARDQHTERTSEYLMGLPLLGDYLAEGLTAMGYEFVEGD